MVNCFFHIKSISYIVNLNFQLKNPDRFKGHETHWIKRSGNTTVPKITFKHLLKCSHWVALSKPFFINFANNLWKNVGLNLWETHIFAEFKTFLAICQRDQLYLHRRCATQIFTADCWMHLGVGRSNTAHQLHKMSPKSVTHQDVYEGVSRAVRNDQHTGYYMKYEVLLVWRIGVAKDTEWRQGRNPTQCKDNTDCHHQLGYSLLDFQSSLIKSHNNKN